MAKLPNILTIAAGYFSTTQLNANFEALKNHFNNFLSLDGSTPNQMQSDLDMNSNDVINVGQLDTTTLTIGGVTASPQLIVDTRLDAAEADIDVLEAEMDTAQADIVALQTGGVGTLQVEQFGDRADVTSATIDASIEIIYVSGYTTPGDGGGGYYKKVGSEPSHEGKVSSNSATVWWELVPQDGQVNVKQFGAVGDGTTDDQPAFINAINFQTRYQNSTDAAGEGYGLVVVVPQTDVYYRMASPLDIQNRVHLRGTGFQGSTGMLVFDADILGIVVNESDTTLNAKRTAGTAASYSTFENLFITCLTPTIATPSSTIHGIRCRTKAHFKDVYVERFPGDGFNFENDIPGNDYTHGNSNYSSLINCKGRHNGRAGLYFDGNNCNAISIVNFDAQNNGRWGIYDDSFLGNHFHSFHISNNAKDGVGYNSGTSGLCHYLGNRYHSVWNATETQLRTTTPGTDESVWMFMEAGSATGAYLEWSGAAVGTFFAGGPLAVPNVNSRSIISGGYVEGSQARSFLEQRSSWFNGLDGAGVYGDGTKWNGENWQGDITIFHPHKQISRDVDLTLFGRSDIFWRAVADGDDPNGLRFQWNETAKSYEFRHGTSDPMLQFSCDLTGGGAVPLSVALPKGVILGPDNQKIISDAGAPGSGTHARGDIRFAPSPSAGGKIGWVCVASGTPGTWKQFGAIDA